MSKTFAVGVGLTKFEKPGARFGWDYPDMAKEAIGEYSAALELKPDDEDARQALLRGVDKVVNTIKITL